jgi:hypothetical protein
MAEQTKSLEGPFYFKQRSMRKEPVENLEMRITSPLGYIGGGPIRPRKAQGSPKKGRRRLGEVHKL